LTAELRSLFGSLELEHHQFLGRQVGPLKVVLEEHFGQKLRPPNVREYPKGIMPE
jgi:hypothetical protein